MSALQTLLEDIAVNRKRASLDLETVSWQTRPSLASMKKEAEERLVNLLTEYSRVVRSNSLGIFLFGAGSDVSKFAEIAAEEANTLTVNANAVYERLAQEIEGSLGGRREFTGTQLTGLIQSLQRLTRELGVVRMTYPDLTDSPVVQDTPALIAQVKKLVRKAVGDDLVRIFLNQQVNKLALEAEFSGNTLPVIVTGAEPDDVPVLASLFTNAKSVSVGTSEDEAVDAEYVLKQFETIRSSLKSNL